MNAYDYTRDETLNLAAGHFDDSPNTCCAFCMDNTSILNANQVERWLNDAGYEAKYDPRTNTVRCAPKGGHLDD